MAADNSEQIGRDRFGLADDATPATRRRTAFAYLATCILVLGALFLLTGLKGGSHYDRHPVDFQAMEAQQFALISALNEPEIAQIKLDYIARGAPPDVGVYGHHIVRGMGQPGFSQSGSLFNFYLNHMTLADTLDVLRVKERLGKLPNDLLLVQISHPYYGSDLAIGDFRELPLGFYWQKALQGRGNLLETVAYLVEQEFFALSLRFDWKHVGYALIELAYGGCQIHGLYGPDSQVREPEPMAIAKVFQAYGLSYLSDKLEAVNRVQCSVPEPAGFRFDGTFVGEPSPPDQFDADARQVFKNGSGKRVWTGSVVEKILGYTREIAALAARNDRLAVFFIPPRLQKFVPNAGHEQADRLVQALKDDDVTVIDNRQDLDKNLFVDGRHLNDTYLRKLLSTLAERELYPRR